MSELISKTEIKMGSERNFGFVFGGVFGLLALFSLWRGGSFWVPALIISGVCLGAALIMPSLLRTPNRLWFKFGLMLHAIFSPIIMFMVYLVAFVPIGLVFRLTGKDPLHRTFEPEAESYWTPRASAPESMKRQF
ncbi:SxtJ family membrane protein [uncultured Aliiroseovarius sp.]|uniref:SxtJ family membrane protein n=1 Tax=uncultured Aliiroseovarius sp. TaxID=1658783 RepID=UPI0026310439|nr:SxtJ family membrane protein [uncultured Aliiroseovarius sp.]